VCDNLSGDCSLMVFMPPPPPIDVNTIRVEGGEGRWSGARDGGGGGIVRRE